MSYRIAILPEAEEGIEKHKKAGNKKILGKIKSFMHELREHPRSGTGKPERLVGYKDCEVWSRRIDSKHRLVYEIRETKLIVLAISTHGHYSDK